MRAARVRAGLCRRGGGDLQPAERRGPRPLAPARQRPLCRRRRVLVQYILLYIYIYIILLYIYIYNRFRRSVLVQYIETTPQCPLRA